VGAEFCSRRFLFIGVSRSRQFEKGQPRGTPYRRCPSSVVCLPSFLPRPQTLTVFQRFADFDFDYFSNQPEKVNKMADAAAPKKRGRPAKSAAEPKEVKEEKKAEKRTAAVAVDGESPAKRGRGRPKGSGKKSGGSTASASKSKGTSGRGRGRPKKSEAASKKDDSAEDEESAADEDAESS